MIGSSVYFDRKESKMIGRDLETNIRLSELRSE